MQHFIHGRKQKITKERVGMKWNFLKNRKKTLSKTATSQDQQWPAINSSAERIRNDIGNQIREGTSRPFAGTGSSALQICKFLYRIGFITLRNDQYNKALGLTRYEDDP